MKRLCTIAAHKEAEIKYLCINPQCTQPSRWICAVCLLKETHNKDPNYKKSFLKDQDEFYELLICKERSNYYQESIRLQVMNKLIEGIKQFQKMLTEHIEAVVSCRKPLLSKIYDETTIFQCDDKNIKEVLNHDPYKIRNMEFKYLFGFVENIENLVKDQLKSIARLKNTIIATEQRPTASPSREMGESRTRLFQEQLRQVVRIIEWPYKLTAHHKILYSLSVSPDSKLIASGGDDDYIILWNSKDGTQFKKLKGHLKSISYLLFTDDSKKVIAGDYGGNIYIWDFYKYEGILTQYKPHNQQINSIRQVNQSEILSVSQEGKIIHSDFIGKKSIYEMSECRSIICMDYSILGFIAVGTSDLKMKLLSLKKAGTVLQERKTNSLQNQILFSKDSNYLFTSCKQGLIKWKIGQDFEITQVQIYDAEERIWAINFYMQNFIICSSLNNLLIIGTDDLRLLKQFETQNEYECNINFSKDQNLIVSKYQGIIFKYIIDTSVVIFKFD